MEISYKGKTMNTIAYEPMSDELFETLRQQHYAKPSFKEVQWEFGDVACRGGVNISKIRKYYFMDLMEKAQVYASKWTPEDVWEYKPLLECFYGKVKRNSKAFGENAELIEQIEAAIRLGGRGIAGLVSQFPIKSVDLMLKAFDINNNWYDMSCGWGSRLLGAMRNRVNYFGTDPNYLLVERLKQMQHDYQSTTHTHTQVDISCQGSEIFVPEWENKIGLCFTSPPYFYLEDYKIGNQSYKQGTTYQSWLDNYLEPTIRNCFKYLIDKGVLAINIKNFDKFKLEEDTIKIAERNGFVFMENFELENISRVKADGTLLDTNENIICFCKKGFENEYKPYKKPEQISLFDFI
jgi:hypothetical protein